MVRRRQWRYRVFCRIGISDHANFAASVWFAGSHAAGHLLPHTLCAHYAAAVAAAGCAECLPSAARRWISPQCKALYVATGAACGSDVSPELAGDGARFVPARLLDSAMVALYRRGVLSLLSTGVRGAVALEVRFLALDKRGPCVRGNGAVCTHGLVDDRSCEGELVSRRHGQHRAGMPNSVDNGHAVATQCAARKVAACNTDSGLGDDSTHRHLADLAPHLAATGQEWNRRHSARARDVPGDASGGAGWS